ncbi:MAG TPA: ATP-binding protein [Spirochaetia bacterium]|nr:ATP-binding protein [Spirochaetia bacterium]
MFETAQQPMLLVKQKGTAFPNAAASLLFGMTGAAEVPLSDLFPPGQPDGHNSERTMAWRGRSALRGWPQSFLWRFRRLDGVLFDCDASLARAEWDGPGTLSITMNLRGAPWVRKAGPTGNLSQRARSREAVARLAGGVAHDFNNLLTAIIGHAQLLGAQPHDKEERDSIDQIEIAAQRAALITHKLLAYSGREPRSERCVKLNELVRGMQGRLQELLDGASMTMRLAPSPGTVTADPSQLEQAVTEVVLNARHAVTRGGSVIIETYSFLAPPGTWAVLAVTDSGPGMEPAACARAFEPYFSAREKGVGAGLGLPSVDGVVRQSGGHVQASSRPGRGTTVTIYLPLA